MSKITLEQLEAAETLVKAYQTLDALQKQACEDSFAPAFTEKNRRTAARADGAFYTARCTLFEAMNAANAAEQPVARWFIEEILGQHKVTTVATDKTDSTEGGE